MKRQAAAGTLAMALLLAPTTAWADATGISELVKKDIPQIREAVTEAMALRDSQGDVAALEKLTALAKESPEIGISNQYLYLEVWRQSSRFAGREDLDWRRQLNEWIFDEMLRLDPSLRQGPTTTMFTLVRNMAGSQAQVGRLGEARRGMVMIEGWLRDGFGLQTDPTRFASTGRGFGVLEDARAREFPATYGEARRDDDPRGGWYPTDELIETTHLDGLVVMGGQLAAEGQWALSAEYAEWTRVAARHHLLNPKQNNQKAVYTYLDGWFLGHSILNILGFDEINRQRLEELVSDPALNNRLNRARGKIDRMLLRNEVMAEGAGEKLLRQIDQLADKSANNTYHLATDDLQTLQLKVLLLDTLGREDAAFSLLDQLIAKARQRNAVTSESVLLRDWARLRIEHGKLDGVEAVLLQLLNEARQRGEKMAEPSLYFRYAQLLTRLDRLDEAILVWREAVRLVEALNLYTRLPEYLAHFANTLDQAGLFEDAAAMRRRAEALLADGRIYPVGIRKRTEELIRNAASKPVNPDPDAPRSDHGENAHPRDPDPDTPEDLLVVLQPRQLLSSPLVGQLATGTFTLSNPGARRRNGQLVTQGMPMRLVQDPHTGFIRGTHDPKAGELALIQLHLGAGQQILVELAAPPPKADDSREIKLEWRDRSGDRASWTIQPSEDGIARAVIDAGLYEENPFFASSLFHHVQSNNPGDPINLRLVASAESRIEVYSTATGGLLCIDANGNGSFGDPGDMIASDADNDGAVDFVPANNTTGTAADLELRVVPHNKIPPEGIEVRLQVRHDGRWTDTAIDTIVPSGTPDE